MTHVFISYVRENSQVVDRLANDLRSRGATVWLDRDDLAPGARWKVEIRKAIESGDFFVACFSKEYNARRRAYMSEELTIAIEMIRQMLTSIWFIPVSIDGSPIPEIRISSQENLGDFNTVDLSRNWSDGVERILRLMGLHDPRLGRALLLAGVARNFETPEGLQAIEQIGKLGIADNRVSEVLVDILADPTYSGAARRAKERAVLTLAKIGESAVPSLAAALRLENIEARMYALSALGRIGPAAALAVPDVVKLLESQHFVPEEENAWSTNPGQRAVEVLAYIGPNAKKAIPYLSPLLSSSSRRLRTSTAFALTKIGPASSAALGKALLDPALQKDVAAGMLWAGETGDAAAVLSIVRNVGVSTALPGLLATTEGDNETLRQIRPTAAFRLLGDMGPEAAPALPFLTALRKTRRGREHARELDSAISRIRRKRTAKPVPSKS
jgi:hypothetical protein